MVDRTAQAESESVRQTFEKEFGKIEIPVLPAAVSRLLAEINSDEPDTGRLEKIISSEPQICAKILRTVNSSHFALRSQVKTIRHAIAMLGLNRVRSIGLSYAMFDAVKPPKNKLFNHEAFWTDTLLRALMARCITRRTRPGAEEEAFTAMMLADISIPVLLTAWEEKYLPVFAKWQGNIMELAQLERHDVGWDHAQASAWILHKWEFPEALVCAAGAHNMDAGQLRASGFGETLAVQVMCASHLPSSLRPSRGRMRNMIRVMRKELGLTTKEWPDIHREIRDSFDAICKEFELNGQLAAKVLEVLEELVGE
ncbi:HDOD domain-containing protein [bacterium]|nr:HDOD domain-containing protein [bacterium]MBU1072886.1 HDOD domain-containing protein [bacterium]MBU1675903.1 HDOD domain-containing protein [bacterium]